MSKVNKQPLFQDTGLGLPTIVVMNSIPQADYSQNSARLITRALLQSNWNTVRYMAGATRLQRYAFYKAFDVLTVEEGLLLTTQKYIAFDFNARLIRSAEFAEFQEFSVLVKPKRKPSQQAA